MNSLCTQSLLTCTPNRRCCSDDLKFDCAEEQGNAASKNAQQRAAMAGMLRPTAFWKAIDEAGRNSFCVTRRAGCSCVLALSTLYIAYCLLSSKAMLGEELHPIIKTQKIRTCRYGQKEKKGERLSACRGGGGAAGLQLRVRFVPAALLAM
jgi:hypothetical protein